MIERTEPGMSNSLRRPYLGDYLWVALALAILGIMITNFILVMESSGNLRSKVPGMPFGAWFYFSLIRGAWRRTYWSAQRRRSGLYAS